MDGTHIIFFCRAHGHNYNFPKLEEHEKDDNISTIILNTGQLMWESNCTDHTSSDHLFSISTINKNQISPPAKINKALNFRIMDDITDREEN